MSNPNGSSILALIRGVPATQVDGFWKLLAGYFTTPPVPSLVLIDSASSIYLIRTVSEVTK